MWYLIGSIIFTIFTSIAVYMSSSNYMKGTNAAFTAFVLPFVFLILSWPVLGATTGAGEGYSEGVRQGYITKVSHKGLIWKTYEAQIQVGTGNQAALQEPFSFSVPPDMAYQVQNLIGEPVYIRYNEWILQPFAEGESGYILSQIELIQEEQIGEGETTE